MRFKNGCNKVVIELRVIELPVHQDTTQFWSEIILAISNRTRAARSFDFEITRMISDEIGLCPGVPVHRGNNYCTPLFTSLCLAVAYCWVYCIGSCVPVHEDRTRNCTPLSQLPL